MSQLCPLCGNNKNNNSLFCDDCKSKLENEYEVDINNNNNNIVKEANDTASTTYASTKSEEQTNKVEVSAPIIEKETPKNKSKGKSIKILLGLILFAFILIVAFFVYKNVILKGNQELSKWNESVKENTISAYLDYMVTFPKGKNYNLAEEAVMRLKRSESDNWKLLQVSDNSAELRDFISTHPNSAYNPLIKKRLDSISWQASLKDNTIESYKRYLNESQNGDFDGYYTPQATNRLSLLTQKGTVIQSELEEIYKTTDGFFVALSAVNAQNIESHLAPRVFLFFNMGGGTKEKIVGDLVISGSKTQSPTIKFIPDMSGITYEKTSIEHYKVNVPLQKHITTSGGSTTVSYGFIVQMELDTDFKIVTITELSPD